MGKTPLVSIIIAHYNNLNYLTNCLESLRKVVFKDFEIIVVDNGSTDNSVKFIKERYDDVNLIENKVNLGFAEANNIGFLNSKGKYILFLNNDTRVEPDFLSSLVTRMKEDPTIGMCQSKLLLLDNPKRLDTIGTCFTSTGFLKHIGLDEEDRGQYNREREIFSPKGACMMIHRSLFERLGGFDKDFFAYFEESDLAWRVWLAGYRIIYIPQSVVYHRIGATTQYLSFLFIQYHSYKNRLCSLIKNLEQKNLVLLLPSHLSLCVALSLVSLVYLEPKRATAVLKAIGWNIRHLKATLRKRKVVQSQIRKVRDKDVFSRVGARIPFTQFWKFIKWFVKEGW